MTPERQGFFITLFRPQTPWYKLAMSQQSTLDQMLAMLSEPATPKLASAPDAVAPSPAPVAAPAPASAQIAQTAAKIASAEDQIMRASAAEFGREFAKAAAAEFEKEGTFAKTASAPGAIDQAAVNAAFQAGMVKGAVDTVARFRAGYAEQLKVAHDLATAAHLTGQAHGATLRKHASDLAAHEAKVASGQVKEAGEGVPLVATLPFGVGPVGALATAPTGHGLEAGARSWAGGVLGAPVGAGLGALAGGALGAGVGYLAGDGDPSAMGASAGIGGGIGASLGGLAGSMMGSNMALQPIYNEPQRMTVGPEGFAGRVVTASDEAPKDEKKGHGGAMAAGALGAGAAGTGAYMGAHDPSMMARLQQLAGGGAPAAPAAAAMPAPTPVPSDFRVVPEMPPPALSYMGNGPTPGPFRYEGPSFEDAHPESVSESVPAGGHEDFGAGVSQGPEDTFGFGRAAATARGALADATANHASYASEHPFHALWNRGAEGAAAAQHAANVGAAGTIDDARSAALGTYDDLGRSGQYVHEQASEAARAAGQAAGQAVTESTPYRALHDIHESMTPGVRSIARGLSDAYESAAPHVQHAADAARQGLGSLYDSASDWASGVNLPQGLGN